MYESLLCQPQAKSVSLHNSLQYLEKGQEREKKPKANPQAPQKPCGSEEGSYPAARCEIRKIRAMNPWFNKFPYRANDTSQLAARSFIYE